MIGVPKRDGENGTKLESTLQAIIQENFLSLATQANIQIQKYPENASKILHEKIDHKTYNHQIQQS